MTITNLYAKDAKERYDSITKKDSTLWVLISGVVTWVYTLFSSHN